MQAFNALFNKTARAKKKSRSDEEKKAYANNVGQRSKRTKIWAGIAVWAKQEGLSFDGAVAEIKGLKMTLSTMENYLCPSEKTAIPEGKTLKQYVRSRNGLADGE